MFKTIFKYWIEKKEKQRQYLLKREILFNEVSANLKATSDILDKLYASTITNSSDIAVVKVKVENVEKDIVYLKKR